MFAVCTHVVTAIVCVFVSLCNVYTCVYLVALKRFLQNLQVRHEELSTTSVMDFDDRQLSSDLEKCLQITPEDYFIPRGPEYSDVKKEFDRISCMSSNFTLPYRHVIETNPFVKCYPTVSSHSHDNNSLSSLGLETDDGSVCTKTLHHILPEMGGHEIHNKFDIRQFPHTDTIKNAMHYPFEDKLMRYEYFNATDEHAAGCHLRQNKQHTQAKSEVLDDDNDVMIIEDIAEELTYEVDEIGEGPLHILSAVMDTTVIAKVLDILQKLGIIKQCINLQSKRKQTPLFLAVQTRNIPYVSWLLDNGADPNIQGTLYINRDEYIWRAPLHLAAMMGDDAIAMVRLLLTKSKHTEINQLSIGDKLTPLHLALMQHSPTRSCRQLIFELIDKGADITIREQRSSKTSFMLAIETRDLNLVRELLERFPAEVCRMMLQEQTRSGDTCLHIAAGLSKIHTSQKEILLRMLVTNGANGSIANNVKELPRDFAKVEWERICKT